MEMNSETEYYKSCDLCGDQSRRDGNEERAAEFARQEGYISFSRFSNDVMCLCAACVKAVVEAAGLTPHTR